MRRWLWLRRPVRRPRGNMKAVRDRGEGRPLLSLLITLVVAGLLFLLFMTFVQRKLHPIVSAVARTQISNMVTHQLERGMAGKLKEVQYDRLVTIQRDQNGAITALTTNMGEVNQLRSQLVGTVAEELEQFTVSEVSIPIGSLFHSEFLWAHGPAIRVKAMWVGNISAEFKSQFSSAGVNQTLHRIWLVITAPMTLLLPGGAVEVPVDSQLCMAETIIVGRVPESYIQMGGPG